MAMIEGSLKLLRTKSKFLQQHKLLHHQQNYHNAKNEEGC